MHYFPDPQFKWLNPPERFVFVTRWFLKKGVLKLKLDKELAEGEAFVFNEKGRVVHIKKLDWFYTAEEAFDRVNKMVEEQVNELSSEIKRIRKLRMKTKKELKSFE